jgi:hypothetical protein
MIGRNQYVQALRAAVQELPLPSEEKRMALRGAANLDEERARVVLRRLTRARELLSSNSGNEARPAQPPQYDLVTLKLQTSERLARLDGERAKLGAQLDELVVAERVLTRFVRPEARERRRSGRAARTASAPAAPQRRARAAQPPRALSVSEAVLSAVYAHPEGATASEVLNHLSREFGMTLRPNHLGIALERHRRAGRLEKWGSRWRSPRDDSSAANRANITASSV